MKNYHTFVVFDSPPNIMTPALPISSMMQDSLMLEAHDLEKPLSTWVQRWFSTNFFCGAESKFKKSLKIDRDSNVRSFHSVAYC